jgi:hypothetical protein
MTYAAVNGRHLAWQRGADFAGLLEGSVRRMLLQ